MKKRGGERREMNHAEQEHTTIKKVGISILPEGTVEEKVTV
jgi:hypothetical protein